MRVTVAPNFSLPIFKAFKTDFVFSLLQKSYVFIVEAFKSTYKKNSSSRERDREREREKYKRTLIILLGKF